MVVGVVALAIVLHPGNPAPLNKQVAHQKVSGEVAKQSTPLPAPEPPQESQAVETQPSEPVKEATPVVAERPVETQAIPLTKTEIMRQAGIPESDYSYVDYIVQKESSWNPEAYNASSGSCGLVQALPCSKIPGDWRNPVNALKWQFSYVTARYGGYAGAYAFWVSNNWY